MQRLIGAKYCELEPGKTTIVTVIWPTRVLYNRVGNCSIKVRAQRSVGEAIDDSKIIAFNTTIDTKFLPDYLIRKCLTFV